MLHLSSLFGPFAVLCRRKPLHIFGCSDGQEVRIQLMDGQGRALASDICPVHHGRFDAVLAPQEAATGCTLIASSGSDKVISENIMIGDVYLAAGQSNMELELQNADEGQQLIPSHQNDQVRYLNVPKIAVAGPENDSAFSKAQWVTIAPGTGKDMSAVAYFCAMKLQKKLQVPVGIIDCYWGGTSITCWMSAEALKGCQEGTRYWIDYEKLCAGKTMEQYRAEEEIAFAKMRAWDEAAAPYREKNPSITGPELEQLIGQYPWKTPDGPGSPYRPGGLNESMLSHVIPASLSGVLYYQGEEDTWRTERYDQLLIEFVRMLRHDFQDEALPFLNVQLPMWIAKDAPDSHQWPRLRLAQAAACKLIRNTSLTCLIDQGEYDNIHPTAKRVVGERLCDSALSLIYHRDAPAAPEALFAFPVNGKLAVHLSEPVFQRDEGELLMEIAGDSGQFVSAAAEIKGNDIILAHPSVSRPVKARYAWTDYGIVRLFGENGYPLAPFSMSISP